MTPRAKKGPRKLAGFDGGKRREPTERMIPPTAEKSKLQAVGDVLEAAGILTFGVCAGILIFALAEVF